MRPKKLESLNLDGPFPQMIYAVGGYLHCGEMDIATEILEVDGRYFLANNGLGIFGYLFSLEMQVQKEITECPGCGERLGEII